MKNTKNAKKNKREKMKKREKREREKHEKRKIPTDVGTACSCGASGTTACNREQDLTGALVPHLNIHLCPRVSW